MAIPCRESANSAETKAEDGREVGDKAAEENGVDEEEDEDEEGLIKRLPVLIG